jgi:hypothetical protein
MKLRLCLLIAAGIALLVWGLNATFASAGRGDPIPVTWFEAPGHVPGDAVLGAYAVQQRGYYSITVNLHTSGLTPGHQYTLWWVIFNNPSACVDGCGSDDLDNAIAAGLNPAGIGVDYGGSFVPPANGKVNLGARILENSVNGCETVAPFANLCTPLIDAETAEAVVFLHDQGPVLSGVTFNPATAFADGCKDYKIFDRVVETYNRGNYDCFSAQVMELQ